jgi:hypothetical protein
MKQVDVCMCVCVYVCVCMCVTCVARLLCGRVGVIVLILLALTLLMNNGIDLSTMS